jgi:very-short-patch-repair endonuclease
LFGPYVLDFYCAKAKLVIEIDGDTHASQEAQIYDQKRTEFIQAFTGAQVIRFTNDEVVDELDRVITKVKKVLSTPPNLPLKRGGEEYRGEDEVQRLPHH